MKKFWKQVLERGGLQGFFVLSLWLGIAQKFFGVEIDDKFLFGLAAAYLAILVVSVLMYFASSEEK